jgi:hypothetical protein
MTVWQIAAGDGPERDYAPLFLRYGMAAVGPGDPGAYSEHSEWYKPGAGSHRGFLRPFCVELADGDLLILKRPKTQTHWHIVAVGQVQGDYHYEPALDDVEGWDLQHMRRVRWRPLPKEMEVAGLTRGTIKRVNKTELKTLAQELWDQHADAEQTPEPLPDRPKDLDDERLIGMLIDRGISSGTAAATAATLLRLRRLARWYASEGGEIGEHEIRTFLIAPLLLALGWPEQRLRIEYQRADIALWDRPFNYVGAFVERIVETKRLYNALGAGPAAQAAGYARNHPNCRALIVTDGFRYKLLERRGERPDAPEWTPAAYVTC